MRSVKKTGVKLFRLSFSTGSASRNSQSKKVEPFFDCVRKPDLGFSRKRPFSTDKSDCIRNGFRAQINEELAKSNFDFFHKIEFNLP